MKINCSPLTNAPVVCDKTISRTPVDWYDLAMYPTDPLARPLTLAPIWTLLVPLTVGESEICMIVKVCTSYKWRSQGVTGPV